MLVLGAAAMLLTGCDSQIGAGWFQAEKSRGANKNSGQARRKDSA
ncbi:hypothetical protein OL548_21710 [Lysinibacillus sp. MHQ-1]|nr:hypothetical protein OL548_21710 [Lysinibacillus sp. MHQ-1]